MLKEDMRDFEVTFRTTRLIGTRCVPPGSTRTAVFLHGGGASTAAGFQDLRAFLYANGISSVAFDFVGHGRTSGLKAGTTLDERVQQVLAVVKSQALEPEAVVLIGFSMGAYVAARVAADLGVPRLCLVVPAAYAVQAYEVPFGPQFTEVLRTPRSWAQSDAFEAIRKYTGHLLVMSAEEDPVVPSEIPRKYIESSGNCASTMHHIVRRSGHNLHEHFEREPEAREAAFAEIGSLCLRDDV